MKKRITALLLALFLLASLVPGTSVSAVTPYFTAVNNTLLSFSESTMPFYYSGVLYVPCSTFSGELGVYYVSSTELGTARLYTGTKTVDFYVSENKSVDQDGRVREGVSARTRNGTVYLPLGLVCSYFDLQYDIIIYEPISIIRIMSNDAVNSGRLVNEETFKSIYAGKMQSYASDYYGSETTPTTPGDDPQPPAQPEPPAPAYPDVTIFLSFYGVSAGSAGKILSSLAEPGYRCCFFVSADDIRQNPGLIRRIAGGGHALGIWLDGGTYDEYLETSKLLFEAAKLKTVLIASGEAFEAAPETASEHGLILWSGTDEYGDGVTENAITAVLPTVSGARQSVMLECSADTAEILPGVLSFLRRNDYTVLKITETTAPVD